MKHLSKIAFFGFCLAVMMASCSSKQERNKTIYDYIRPATMEYTKADSAQIKNDVTLFANYVKANDLKSAANMLYKFRNDSIIPYTEAQKEAFIKAYSQMPIYDAKLQNFILRSDRNNEIIFLIQVTKDGSIEEEKGVSRMFLNPVYRNGKWYVTLLDKHAQGVVDVYDPNVRDY